MLSVKSLLVFLGLVSGAVSSPGASGLFPKMPPTPNAWAIDCHKDTQDARLTVWALQGLINQRSAEVYIADQGRYWEQLRNSGKSFTTLSPLDGTNGGLRCLFQKYQGHVKKMFVFDSGKVWTWH